MLAPLPFSPPLEPRTFGAIYEIRTYTYGTGFMPQVIERWAEKIPRRMLSPFIGRLPDDHRPQTQLVHIWAYRDAAERQRIRTRTIATGAWAPNTHAGRECGSASRTSSRFRPPSRRFASWHGRAAPAAEPPVIHHTSGGHE